MCFWNPFSMSLPNLSETQTNISIMSVQCVFPFLRVNAGRHNNRTAFGCWENPGVLGKHKAQIQPPGTSVVADWTGKYDFCFHFLLGVQCSSSSLFFRVGRSMSTILRNVASLNDWLNNLHGGHPIMRLQ